MPPRNPARSITGEAEVASRIGYERELRGWSYEQLARRMTDVGCPMNQSAIYKIEKGSPRRRITVDELVGFAIVFDTTVDQLVLPRWMAEDAQAAKLWTAWNEAEQNVDAAKRAFDEYLDKHPDVMERVLQSQKDRESEHRG